MNTKKILYIATILVGLLFASCDSLDLGPIDNYGNNNYWKTLEQVKTYNNNIHYGLRGGKFTTSFILGEARGGTQRIGVGAIGQSTRSDIIKDNKITEANPGISNWAGLYSSIFDCNLLINNVENSDIHKNSKKEVDVILGQVYGVRAYNYFLLYKTFGGVPLVTNVKVLEGKIDPNNLYTKRSSPKETMEQIKADIQKSLDFFGTNQDAGKLSNVYWSKVATEMLGAEVYLWSAKVSLGSTDGIAQKPDGGDLAKAEGFLNSVKNDSRYGLMDNFEDVTLASSEAKAAKEVIFAINYAEGEAEGTTNSLLYTPQLITDFYDKNGVSFVDPLLLKGRGEQRYEYLLNFYKTFDDRDKRRDATFMEIYDGSKNLIGLSLKKFLGSINNQGNRVLDSNEPIYRYSDVLLMLAEVENMKGGDPAKYINDVRKRAYGDKWNQATDAYKNSDFKTNELAILHERDKEFVFEGKRWFDVLRMKDAKDGKSLVFDKSASYTSHSILDASDAYKVLWPIAVNTLNDDTELKQTPGYGNATRPEEVW